LVGFAAFSGSVRVVAGDVNGETGIHQTREAMVKTGVGRLLRSPHVFGPEMLEDPYPRYRELRESSPVFWDESLKAWVLTRHDDVVGVLNDVRFSSVRIARAQSRLKTDRYRPLLDIMSHKVSEKDEPDHARLRSLMNRAFAHVAVERWEPKIRSNVNRLLNGFREAGCCEFIADFAVPLPLMMILELVGVPADDHQQVKKWCDAFAFVALNYYTFLTEEQMEDGLTGMQEFGEYLRKRVDWLGSHPEDNLLCALIAAEHEDSSLSMEELLANTFLLLSAGNETTTCLLGNGLALLLKHPEQMQRLREHPELLPRAVEEFLRFDSPVQFLGRLALEDVELRSTRIRQGDLILAVLGAANRDPARFADPDVLDIGREDNHHLAFGHGRHFCVGAQFARLEARLAFQALLEMTSDISLDSMAVNDLSHHDNFNIRCLKQLPLRFTFKD
jgi:cytochrome P450